MGTKARPRPQRLATKLLAIRNKLELGQARMAQLLNVAPCRVSEYEQNMREPNLLTLLAYARVAHIPVEYLIDDDLDLDLDDVYN